MSVKPHSHKSVSYLVFGLVLVGTFLKASWNISEAGPGSVYGQHDTLGAEPLSSVGKTSYERDKHQAQLSVAYIENIIFNLMYGPYSNQQSESPEEIIENYLWTYFVPRDKTTPFINIYNPYHIDTILSQHNPESIAVATSFFKIPRDAYVLREMFDRFLPVLHTLMSGELFEASGMQALVKQLVAHHKLILNTPQWQNHFVGIEHRIAARSKALRESKLDTPYGVLNAHSCDVWKVFKPTDCSPDELWYYSFWYRRWKEDNIGTVREILDTTLKLYQPKPTKEDSKLGARSTVF